MPAGGLESETPTVNEPVVWLTVSEALVNAPSITPGGSRASNDALRRKLREPLRPNSGPGEAPAGGPNGREPGCEE